MTIKELMATELQMSFEKGWWDDCIPHPHSFATVDQIDRERVKDMIPEKLMLIVTEVAECMDAYRDPKHDPAEAWYGENNKPEGLPSELADVVIRVCGLSAALGIDLEAAIAEKLAYNQTRSFRHGGKRA